MKRVDIMSSAIRTSLEAERILIKEGFFKHPSFEPIPGDDKIFIESVLNSFKSVYDDKKIKKCDFKYAFQSSRFIKFFRVYSQLIISRTDSKYACRFTGVYTDEAIKIFKKFINEICAVFDAGGTDLMPIITKPEYRWFVTIAVLNILNNDSMFTDFIIDGERIGYVDIDIAAVVIGSPRNRFDLNRLCLTPYTEYAARFANIIGIDRYNLLYIPQYFNKFDELWTILKLTEISTNEEYTRILSSMVKWFCHVREDDVKAHHKVTINGTVFEFDIPDIDRLDKWVADVFLPAKDLKDGLFKSSRAIDQIARHHDVLKESDISPYDESGFRLVYFARKVATSMSESPMLSFDNYEYTSKARDKVNSIFRGSPSKKYAKSDGSRIDYDYVNKFIDVILCTEYSRNLVIGKEVSDNTLDDINLNYYVELYDENCDPIIQNSPSLQDVLDALCTPDAYKFMHDHHLNKYDLCFIYIILKLESKVASTELRFNDVYDILYTNRRRTIDDMVESGMDDSWAKIFNILGRENGLKLYDAINEIVSKDDKSFTISTTLSGNK